jgi:predicted nucleic acid-binding protein
MTILVDTNLLLRGLEPAHPHHRLAGDAPNWLRQQGHSLVIVPQVLYELWVVATRATTANGLGLSVVQAKAELTRLQLLFRLLPDNAAVFVEWERLVTSTPVLGRDAHDSRLVAAMIAHGVTHLLTFNGPDFRRFSGITVLDSAGVGPPPAPPTP